MSTLNRKQILILNRLDRAVDEDLRDAADFYSAGNRAYFDKAISLVKRTIKAAEKNFPEIQK